VCGILAVGLLFVTFWGRYDRGFPSDLWDFLSWFAFGCGIGVIVATLAGAWGAWVLDVEIERDSN